MRPLILPSLCADVCPHSTAISSAMAYMQFNNYHPVLYADYVWPTRRYSIGSDPVILLIEEVIDYSLRRHNLPHWTPPVDLDFARRMNDIRYFNPNFAATAIRPCIERQAMQLANRRGFNDEVWLGFTDHEKARRYLENYISYIHYFEKPFLFQMFSFACYASRIALQNHRHSLVNDVVWAFHAVLLEILPNEEYVRQTYFVASVYYNLDIDNATRDIDEGVGDEDTSSSWCLTDMVFLFVEELINDSLRQERLYHWYPCIDLETLRKKEMSYFTENIGEAVTHVVTEYEAVSRAQQLGFDVERWLGICRSSEARTILESFLMHLFRPDNVFPMLSFACYCSKLALQRDRNSLVNEVVWALFVTLRKYYPLRQHYEDFDELARQYIDFVGHMNSEDEGIGN